VDACSVTPTEVTDLSKQMPYCNSKGFHHEPGARLCASDLQAADNKAKSDERGRLIAQRATLYGSDISRQFPTHFACSAPSQGCTALVAAECDNAIMASYCHDLAAEVTNDNKKLQACVRVSLSRPQNILRFSCATATPRNGRWMHAAAPRQS